MNGAGALNLTQAYSYDSLNRIQSAIETGGSGGWSQTYNQDLAGNQWVPSSSSTLPALTLETPQTSSWYSASTIPNRINGWTSDSAGNVRQTGSVARSFTYDGENRQVTATIGSATSNYAYDGDGLRVSKVVDGSTTTIYVYDAWGNLAAEYSSLVEASPCGTPTCYPVVDHLGSMRMLTDSAGSTNVKRDDYLPYGMEILAGVDSRTTTMGYVSGTPDDTNPKFTGKERDAETGLDFFDFRYLSGAQGRFTSPDDPSLIGDPSNPQSWNLLRTAGTIRCAIPIQAGTSPVRMELIPRTGISARW